MTEQRAEHYFQTKKQNLEDCVNVLPSVLQTAESVRVNVCSNDILSRPIDIARELKVAS